MVGQPDEQEMNALHWASEPRGCNQPIRLNWYLQVGGLSSCKTYFSWIELYLNWRLLFSVELPLVDSNQSVSPFSCLNADGSDQVVGYYSCSSSFVHFLWAGKSFATLRPDSHMPQYEFAPL